MIIKLEHTSIPTITCWNEILNDCFKLSTFLSRVDSFAEKINDQDIANKFKGDVFEILCEIMIRMSPLDDRIGISDYHVAPVDEPGVDGFGTNFIGEALTVQIKWRQWDYDLDAARDHLNNFRAISFAKYGVDPTKTGNMLIITSGKGVHFRTLYKQFDKKVRFLSRNASFGCLRGMGSETIPGIFSLKTLLDDNKMFWQTFLESVKR